MRMKLAIWHRNLGAASRCYCFFLLLMAVGMQAQDSEWLSRKVQMKGISATRYELLRDVSEQTGYLFVYDSQTLNNDTEVNIRKGEYTLRDAIISITGNPNIQISLIGSNHIALRLPGSQRVTLSEPEIIPETTYFTVSGTVYDIFSKEPLSSATIGVPRISIGTVTNKNGRFRLTLPDSLLNATIRISHVGYENLEFEAASRVGGQSSLMLEPKVVSLQEVVVRVINPRQNIQEMMKRRPQNYAESPVYLTAFYREGVEHKKRNVDLTEGVLKVYKTSFVQSFPADQVKVIKMRRIIDRQERDTIVTKVKSGIHSTLFLDLIKTEPDFFDIDNPNNPFEYTHTDIAVIDNRLANVITFEQRKNVKQPLYQGELFIDTENHALLEAHIRVHPQYVEKATPLFVEKRSKNHKLTLRDTQYIISYKSSADGVHHLSHVRGELEFRVRRKRHWFSSTLRVWFELVNCKVDTENVQPIPRAERISPRTVFSETRHAYDANFWGNFNVILPEDELKDLILNNLTEVME